jgi:hypothetical protein
MTMQKKFSTIRTAMETVWRFNRAGAEAKRFGKRVVVEVEHHADLMEAVFGWDRIK